MEYLRDPFKRSFIFVITATSVGLEIFEIPETISDKRLSSILSEKKLARERCSGFIETRKRVEPQFTVPTPRCSELVLLLQYVKFYSDLSMYLNPPNFRTIFVEDTWR